MPTGEQPAAQINERTTTDLKMVALIVSVAIGIASIGALARAAGNDAGTALTKTADLEPRVVRLEEQRKSDAELLRTTADALRKNTEVLQAVQVELARKK